MVLFTASRGNTFVGGTCALLSALLVIDAFITRTHSVVILNQRRWQSLGWQHGKGVDK